MEVVVYPERAVGAAVGLAGGLVEALLERLGWPEGIFYSLIGYEVIPSGLRLLRIPGSRRVPLLGDPRARGRGGPRTWTRAQWRAGLGRRGRPALRGWLE